MGDWLRNDSDRATAGRPEKNSCGLQPLTLSDLGIEKTDAFRLQRFWDWEQTLSTTLWTGERLGVSNAAWLIDIEERTDSEIPLSVLVGMGCRNATP